jgi:hypothetical protein
MNEIILPIWSSLLFFLMVIVMALHSQKAIILLSRFSEWSLRFRRMNYQRVSKFHNVLLICLYFGVMLFFAMFGLITMFRYPVLVNS